MNGTPTGQVPITNLHTADLAAISLEDLISRADLQTRVDRKYLVHISQVDGLLRSLQNIRVLDIDGRRSFGYQSVYFDTPRLDAYHAAAHQRRRRFKVRTRTYLDSGESWMEVKTRGSRQATVKHRRPAQPQLTGPLVGEELGYVSQILADDAQPLHLALVPTLITRFNRTTVLLETSTSRLTIDTDLVWRLPQHGEQRSLRDLAVVETKSANAPSPADRLLWQLGVRPQRVSKYATGMALLHPGLPSNRWRRTLDRHVLPHTGAGLNSHRYSPASSLIIDPTLSGA